MDASTVHRRSTASEIATDLLRAAIIDGQLPPGERLKETALAKRFQISRTPVREALRNLQQEGLIDTAPNRGAVVRIYSVDDLREIYGLRALLEGDAARRAAQWIDADRLQQLRVVCDQFSTLQVGGASVPELVRANMDFHAAVIDAADSPRLADLIRRIVEMPLIYRTYSWYSEEQRRAAHGQHLRLIRAFETRDADRAELVMKHHIMDGADVLLEHLTSAAVNQETSAGR